MEKLLKNANGQWTLIKVASIKPKPPVTEAQIETPEPGQLSPKDTIHRFIDSLPDEHKNALMEGVKNKQPHDPEHLGQKIKIKPDQIVHVDNFPGGEEELQDAMDNEDIDYDYRRGQDGRVYQKLFTTHPDYKHLHNKYIATNRHENDADDSPYSLTGAEDMGVVFKKPSGHLN